MSEATTVSAGQTAGEIVGALGVAQRAAFAAFVAGFLSQRAPDLLAEMLDEFLELT